MRRYAEINQGLADETVATLPQKQYSAHVRYHSAPFVVKREIAFACMQRNFDV